MIPRPKVTNYNEVRVMAEFENYAIAHIKTHNAIPCTFMTPDGIILDGTECWFYGLTLRLERHILGFYRT